MAAAQLPVHLTIALHRYRNGSGPKALQGMEVLHASSLISAVCQGNEVQICTFLVGATDDQTLIPSTGSGWGRFCF